MIKDSLSRIAEVSLRVPCHDITWHCSLLESRPCLPLLSWHFDETGDVKPDRDDGLLRRRRQRPRQGPSRLWRSQREGPRRGKRPLLPSHQRLLEHGWFTYGRGGSSIGSTSDYGSRGPSGSLAFFYSSLSYPSICGVSLNSSHMEIHYYRFSTFQQINWRLRCAAWHETSFICTEWGKKLVHLV